MHIYTSNCFGSIINFGQISKFKNAIIPREKNESKFPMDMHTMYLHIMSLITTKFHEILLNSFRGVALINCFHSIFHFGQISKFKKGVIPRKKLNKNFLWICTSTHYVLHYYKVPGNSVERFQWS